MLSSSCPGLPEGRLVRIEDRGELFARIHRHPDPAAPVVLLLHGWTASSDLQFVMAYEALAARYTFVGIDGRGHGRGLRAPDPFALEDSRTTPPRSCASSASVR
jgi:pimeloyl-ACP methyl ester carboxylesterase